MVAYRLLTKPLGHTRKYESKRTAAWGLGQGTLELIKVGRFVIQAGLKSTGQESKCLGAQLQLPGEGCRVGERGRIDGEVRTCTQEPAKLHNETS